MTNDPVNQADGPGQLPSQRVAILLGRLVALAGIMALALLLIAAAQLGELLNYFQGDPIIWGGSAVLAALAGFVAGWLAARGRR